MINVYVGKDSIKKRQYIYNSLKSGSTVITPEQSTLLLEKQIIDSLNIDGLLNINVTSFKRMINKLVLEIFSSKNKHITDVGIQMMFRYILRDLSKQFKLFSTVSDNEEFIQEIIYTIQTLESEGIDTDALLDISNTTEYSDVANKMYDIYIIYKEYLDRINGKFFHIDEGKRLFDLYAKDFNVFSLKSVWIIGFKAFDKNSLDMIKIIAKNTDELNIVLAYEDDEIHSISKMTMNYLQKELEKINIIELNTSDEKFTDFSKNLILNIDTKVPKDIRLLKSVDMYSEVEYIALDILKKLEKDEKLKPDDFRIVIGSEDYGYIIESVFSRMNIDFFTDARKLIVNNKIIKTIISIFNIYVYGFNSDDVISFLKGYALIDDWDTVDAFEKYVFENGIEKNKFLKKFKDENMEQVRIAYLEEIIRFRKKVAGKKTPKEFSLIMIELLEKLDFKKTIITRIDSISEELSNVLVQVYNKVIEIFEQLYLVSTDDKISLFKYLEYFKSALRDVSVGVVPPINGCVVIASVSRSVHDRCKYLYVLGLNEGSLPKDYKDNDLLKEEEKELISSMGYNVLSSNYNRNLLDVLDEYTMFSFCTDAITFSYSGVDLKGSSLVESRYATYLEENGVSIVDFRINDNYLDSLYYLDYDIKYRYLVDKIKNGGEYKFKGVNESFLNDVIKSLNEDAEPITIKKDNNIIVTSVSRLELYNRCPFSYFIRYDLASNEFVDYSIDSKIKGIFIHEVLEKFFKRNLYIRENIDVEVENIINEISLQDEYGIFNSTYRNKYELSKVKQTLQFIVSNIVDKMKSSEFKPSVFEQNIRIEENEYILNGFIDRIDVFNDYFSIIDYKSGNKKLDFFDVYYGLNMQLPLYADAYAKLNNLKPAGMFYLQVKNYFSTELDDREQLVKLNGLFIGDENLAKKYDAKLEEDLKSNYIDVRLKKTGEFYSNSKVLSREIAKKLIEKAKSNALDTVKKIKDGDVSISPVEVDGSSELNVCKYCNYKSICRKDDKYIVRELKKMNKEDVLLKLGEDNEVL